VSNSEPVFCVSRTRHNGQCALQLCLPLTVNSASELVMGRRVRRATSASPSDRNCLNCNGYTLHPL